MADDIDYIDLDEFHDEGYLQEANRRFLHPLGLALEVRAGWSRESIDEFLRERDVQFGQDAVDNILTFVRKLGLDRTHLSGVWDYRDHPAGISYGDGTAERAKSQRVAELWEERAPAREATLGYMVQDI